MSFSLRIRAPVLYASWRAFTLADLHVITQRVADLRRDAGREIVYVSRIPADGRVFSDEEYASLTHFLLTILPSCSSVHHIVEGDGFVKSARFAILTNMAMATPRPRDFFVYATLAEAAAAVSPLSDVDLVALAREPPVRIDAGNQAALSPSSARASSAFRAAARIAVEGRKPRR